MQNLNIDLSQYNPAQSDGSYTNVPLPSAHLVVIEESEMKESTKDGYTRGTNLMLDLTILASSTGNEHVGGKIQLYIPFAGFEESTIKAGMRRLSTLAHTLGIGAFLQNKQQLHGQNFVIVLEKQKNNNFPNFKKILRFDGKEIADASGNFKDCNLNDNVLQTELDKLLAAIALQPAVQQQPVVQQMPFVQPVTQQPVQPSFVPQQPSFGQQVPQQPSFGQQVPQQPSWGQQVNPQNGQS